MLDRREASGLLLPMIEAGTWIERREVSALRRLRGSIGECVRSRAADARCVAAVGAAFYFVVVALGLLWAWGSPLPDTFITSDESTNRLAATLVAETGSPVLEQPFEDPEDLVHLGTWYSREGEARPSYPPFTFYLYGFAMRVGGPWEWLPLIVGAGGVAALAAAGALLLPAERRWYGLLLPLVAFPFTFWVLRPWHNSGLAYTFLAMALLCFALWMRGGRFRYFVGCAGLLLLCGATRPDLLLYLFGSVYLLALNIEPSSWRRVTATLAIGGAGAIGVVALLNWAAVGNPLQSGYQEWASQPYWSGAETRGRLPTPFEELVLALAPNGFNLGVDLLVHLGKQWLLLGPIAVVGAWGALGYASLLRSPRRRWLLLAVGAVFAVFVVTRFCPHCSSVDGWPSVASPNSRYLAAAYLLPAVVALRVLLEIRGRWARSLAISSLWVLTIPALLPLGGYFWVDHTLRAGYEVDAAQLSASLPEDTVVYTRWLGRPYVWSTPGLVHAGMPGNFPRDPDDTSAEVSDADFERLASSIRRAREAGLQAAVLGLRAADAEVLAGLLAPEWRLVESAGPERVWLVQDVPAVAGGLPEPDLP